MSGSTPAQHNLTNYRGDTQTYSFTFKVNGTAEDLTGATILSQIRRNIDDDTILATMAYNASDSDLPNGVVAIDLTAADSNNLPHQAYYDVQYTIGSVVKTRVAGIITTKRDVSRS